MPDCVFYLHAHKRISTFSAAKIGAILLFISTDYVFDGKKPPYSVDAQPNPLNKYGKSKLDGERVVMETNKGRVRLNIVISY